MFIFTYLSINFLYTHCKATICIYSLRKCTVYHRTIDQSNVYTHTHAHTHTRTHTHTHAHTHTHTHTHTNEILLYTYIFFYFVRILLLCMTIHIVIISNFTLSTCSDRNALKFLFRCLFKS